MTRLITLYIRKLATWPVPGYIRTASPASAPNGSGRKHPVFRILPTGGLT